MFKRCFIQLWHTKVPSQSKNVNGFILKYLFSQIDCHLFSWLMFILIKMLSGNISWLASATQECTVLQVLGLYLYSLKPSLTLQKICAHASSREGITYLLLIESKD